MPQRHLDRLSSTDASFLHQEGPTSHMHIGGVLVFEGPPPDFNDYLDHVRGRLHLVPRYRQKLSTPPLETGRPLWVDDPDFNLEYHVRHTALPAPGTEEQLLLLAARIASQPLDRDKPLWENWIVEGLEGDRFALISKTHHSLVDGISGVDLATVLLDLRPSAERHPEDLEPCDSHSDELAASGSMLMAYALTPRDMATSVRADAITDGPFLDSKEVVAGFYVIEAPDLDAALAIARTNPVVRDGGGVEVRPVHSAYLKPAAS